MKDDSSTMWRKEGDEIAFDHDSWEFKSRQFEVSGKRLLDDFESGIEAEDYSVIPLLPTAEFLFSLAIEIIGKALYLKLGSGPKEQIYNHDILQLLDHANFTESELSLIGRAKSNVIWAGRYPTPKWTKEQYKEDYDVPSVWKNGVEHFNALDMPNATHPDRVKELHLLYLTIHKKWTNA